MSRQGVIELYKNAQQEIRPDYFDHQYRSDAEKSGQENY